MALATAITWEVRNGGSDNNGGGFKTGATGTDYSVQDASQFSGTDLVVDAVTNTKVTSATHNFVSTDVGNIIQITAGAGFTTGFYEIVSVASNAATLDRSPAATGTTGGTWAEGGGLATPGKAGGAKVAGNNIFIKYNASAYLCTSTSFNVASGMILDSTGAADTKQSFWVGYDTNRTLTNIDANRPTLQASGAITNFTIFAASALNVTLRNVILDANSKTGGKGAQFNASFGGGRIYNVKALNCPNIGFDLSDFSRCYFCEANTCGGTAGFYLGASGATANYCVAQSCSTDGFVTVNNSFVTRCISINNTGKGFLDSSTAYCTFIDCIAYGNSSDGFSATAAAARANTFMNCVSISNGAYGFNVTAADQGATMINCAYYNNTSGNVNGNITFNLGGILLTGVPFTNAASKDFTPNNTAGQGAAIRGLGYPRTWPGLSTTNYLDIGAVQHQDPSGGSSSIGVGIRVISPPYIIQ